MTETAVTVVGTAVTVVEMAGPAGVGPHDAEPEAECDVVMKGGITSGVVYPKALQVIAKRYRLRGVGGASAGAIGAALGAAAEHGRSSGGFERLGGLPAQLADGRLARLFQPQPATRSLMRLMLAATANGGDDQRQTPLRKLGRVLWAMVRGFPIVGLIGLLPGAALITAGAWWRGSAGWLLVLSGMVLVLFGWATAVAIRLIRLLTVQVPANRFGICSGLGAAGSPGLTDWLAEQLDEVAGLADEQRPLRFGHLWTGSHEIAAVVPADRRVDLRMITTCLSEGRPYEMPWGTQRFFYDPVEWRQLFPDYVMSALDAAPERPLPHGDDRDTDDEDEPDEEWLWEDSVAASHDPPLRRLPAAEHLPVIVATRLSLSFPLLISAVPLWTVDRRRTETQAAVDEFRRSRRAPATGTQTAGQQGSGGAAGCALQFSKAWFTDGGFCSNFPVHLFDAALPSRPTFDINLGRFEESEAPDVDERKNVRWAKSNSAGLLSHYVSIPERGMGALGGFASAAFNAARNWQDSSHLAYPGYRDRIVQVLQTKTEGGLNLHMDGATLNRLATRGGVAAEILVEQFTQPRYPRQAPWATGWDNHRWVRYRALMSVLPPWLASYARGRSVLRTEPESPPSYRFVTKRARLLAEEIDEHLCALAETVASADEGAVRELTRTPNPQGMLRRIPQI